MSFDPVSFAMGSKGGGGSGGGVLVVHVTESSGVYTADKTAGEIKAALQSGIPVTIPYVAIDNSSSPSASFFALGYVGAGGINTNVYDGNLMYIETIGYALVLGKLICGTNEDLVLIAATEADYPTSGS